MEDSANTETMKGVDGFEYSIDHPRFEAHQLVSQYLLQIPISVSYRDVKISDYETGRLIFSSSPEMQAKIVCVAFERRFRKPAKDRATGILYPWALQELFRSLMRRKLAYDRDGIEYLLTFAAKSHRWTSEWPIIKAVILYVAQHGLSETLKSGLEAVKANQDLDNISIEKKQLRQNIDTVLGVISLNNFEPGEIWANAANEALQKLPAPEAAAWSLLITHCKSAIAGKPSAKWLKEAKPKVDAIGFISFSEHLQSWLKLFASHHEAVNETNLDALKGLVWCASLQNDVALLRAVAHAVPACVKNVDTHRTCTLNGAIHEYLHRIVRAPRLTIACLWMLSQSDNLEAVAQLARLRLEVRHKGDRNAIEKAVVETAKRLDVAPEELEELATPDFGLQNGGLRRAWNDVQVAIDFATGKAVWHWQDDSGKTLKAPPAKWKIEYSNELKELKTLASEVEKTLVVVKERLDLMLRLERSWTYQAWRERYFDHALLGAVSRRVIWNWEQNGASTIGIWHDDHFVDFNGASVAQPALGATIRLWHPINAAPETVAAWRRWLETTSTRQPFKQAHREIYLLTDAERNTRIYSNRFASHIVRQHQFNSLCAARGWKNKLRLMVDDTYPPATKLLPQHNLRAEFWIEGIGDGYGVDTNDTGTYLRLTTDQVRFYRLDDAENQAQAGAGDYGARGWGAPLAEPLPLEEIPPLVFSEVMRDVDLFVGVASVGNDPTWNDGGPEGRFINYWESYAFGELTATAQTRRDVLSRLLPRLKIANRCELLDKWLQVRGDLRTYKIHLGSGNILMEPNDQYLCIVPSRGASSEDKVFLPFEGDHTLAIVLSKAFMLADDTKISDASIVSQIKQN